MRTFRKLIITCLLAWIFVVGPLVGVAAEIQSWSWLLTPPKISDAELKRQQNKLAESLSELKRSFDKIDEAYAADMKQLQEDSKAFLGKRNLTDVSKALNRIDSASASAAGPVKGEGAKRAGPKLDLSETSRLLNQMDAPNGKTAESPSPKGEGIAKRKPKMDLSYTSCIINGGKDCEKYR